MEEVSTAVEALDGLRCTDAGNAKRLAAKARDRLLYVPGPGWMLWDGKRWKRDRGHLVYELAKATARSIYVEASEAKADNVAEMLGKWAHSSESRGRIEAMVALSRSESAIRLDDVGQLDALPNVLNVANGVLDLDDLTVAEHDPRLLQTKLTRAAYRPEATCPFWEASLEYFLPDPEVRRWVQMAAGYSMLGSYSEWLFIPYGPGSNFKSTFLWALRHTLGDYACEAAPELLTERRERGAASDAALADLRGMRMVTTIETAQGKKMAEALMKQLTGESTLKAKFMRQDYFEFTNTAAVWLATNHKPFVQGTDYAAWRRIRLVPFAVTVPPEMRREPEEVKTSLALEADGILRWLVDGLRAYKQREPRSLDPAPPAVDAATAAYREEMDALGQWFADCCVEGGSEPVTHVRDSYERYCKENGMEPVKARRFNEQLEERGYRREQQRVLGKKTKCWTGFHAEG